MIDTSTTYSSHDDISHLNFEVRALKNDLDRNSREIHSIQIRDLQSIEDMRYYLQHRRQLGERARNLKAQILKLYLYREGSPVKMEEWMNGLNIPLSPNRQLTLHDDTGLASNHHYYDELNIGDIHDTVKQSTDEFLEQLTYKIQQLEDVVNSSSCLDSSADNPSTARSRPECSAKDDAAAGGGGGGGGQTATMAETAVSQQHRCKQDALPGAVPSIDIASQSTPLNLQQQQQPSSVSQASASATKAARPRLKYPANVELKTIHTPPILPHKRRTVTAFTTRHNVGPKENLAAGKTVNKHKHVGDYMVHGRNTAAGLTAPGNSSAAAQTRGILPGFVWTVIVIGTLSALFFLYPPLLDCILLLRDGAEQSLDEVTRILDSIIVRAGGSPWLGSFTKTSSFASSSLSSLSSQNVVEQAKSTWEMVLDYARTAYRYVLFDFP